MGFLSRFLSFEKPIGDLLTRVLYYLGCLGAVYYGIRQLWFWITYLDNDFMDAIGGILWTPVRVVIAIMILRVVAEFVLSQFRMDKSLHDQVTGRAVPAKTDD